jgi:hypothetical protein
MNIPTPLSVQFANHRGMKSNPHIIENNIKLYPVSTQKGRLPEGLCVSFHGNHWTTFRFCYNTHLQSWYNQYFEIGYTLSSDNLHYSGQSADYKMHQDMMRTFDIVLPIAKQVFESGSFSKAA